MRYQLYEICDATDSTLIYDSVYLPPVSHPLIGGILGRVIKLTFEGIFTDEAIEDLIFNESNNAICITSATTQGGIFTFYKNKETFADEIEICKKCFKRGDFVKMALCCKTHGFLGAGC